MCLDRLCTYCIESHSNLFKEYLFKFHSSARNFHIYPANAFIQYILRSEDIYIYIYIYIYVYIYICIYIYIYIYIYIFEV